MEIKYKIWLEKDGKVIFGHGREELLQAVAECHSLNAAAKKLNMSYRAAWGRLRASEDRLGIKLIESDAAKKRDDPNPRGHDAPGKIPAPGKRRRFLS